jgi:hypothetical protein
MPRYLRARTKGGTFFFTVTLANRASNLLTQEITHLRRVYRAVQQIGAAMLARSRALSANEWWARRFAPFPPYEATKLIKTGLGGRA